MNKNIMRSDKLEYVHSDIRGPLYFEAMRMGKEGEKVLKLNTGNPASFGFTMPDSIRKALLDNVDKAVPYCDLHGMDDARAAIRDYHESRGIHGIELDDIFITNGVSEAVTMALTALLSNGDEFLVPTPSYSLWTNSVYAAGARPVFYRCDEQSDWYPDVQDIKSKITNKTQGIVLINPNNPTGAVYPKEILLDILEVARQNNLIVFSDEIYDRLVYDGTEHISTASLAPDLPVFTFNGLSKSHSICGFRCGWMVMSGLHEKGKDLYEGILQLAAMRLCSNALTQLVIPAAMKDRQSTRDMIVPGGRLYEQRKATLEVLSDIDGVSVIPNRAAFYIFPRVDAKKFNLTDDKKLAEDYLHSKKILVIPGSGFDFPTPDHFRIVMLPEPEILRKAMLDLKDFLSTYRQ